MHYLHVDVFSSQPYSGNSLAVFPDSVGLSGKQMTRNHPGDAPFRIGLPHPPPRP